MSSGSSNSVGKDTVPSKFGILIVGLGGNNGVTLLAGMLANNRGLSWETASSGRVSAPNWNGCITQLEPKGRSGVGGGFKNRGYELADATTAAVVGGWDIRSTKLGDALYESRVLEYDLVRQVRGDMNSTLILPGIYDASFLGESQYDTATNIVATEKMSWKDKVERLRKDIRSFISGNNIDGHTTVIWSASVERPNNLNDTVTSTADELLNVIVNDSNSEVDISPSMLYAIAAALEGCSFVNGGSQNTLSPAMTELFDASYRQKKITINDLFSSQSTTPSCNAVSTDIAYLLGTDFKAGQTKFKTAAVEYIRSLGLTPRVIASSNHLGNNDMLNLTSKKTINAKLRVKKDIFAPWEETQLDHKVTVMYTPFMLDEKRDVVEYTSLGFLHCPHTMLTYTRCMDSVLCVPLMIDVAVWCDYFTRQSASPSSVACATAYLFKVPEGHAQGVDPGFQCQMRALEIALQETQQQQQNNSPNNDDIQAILQKGVKSGIITVEQAKKLVL